MVMGFRTKKSRWLAGQAWVLVFVAGWLFSSSAFAQTGSITGVVRDESNAVIPGANVTVTNVETGVSRSSVTDTGGRYRVPTLIPGQYEVRASVEGFETSVRTGIQLTVGAELAIPMELRIGQVTQTTVVTAEAPLVETVRGTISGLVDDRAIRDLPLNGRSFDQLIALESSAPIMRLSRKASVAGRGTTYSVSGSRGQDNRYFVDGIELTQVGYQTNLPGGAMGNNMGVEAIREFSVITSSAGAEYGKKAGGAISVVSRSGTNTWHGSAFGFHRNDNLDANEFFLNKGNQPKPEFRRNQFGGSLGGPIATDRSFLFGSFEGLREGLGLSVNRTVPDENARRGLLPDLGTGCVNPNTGNPFSGCTIRPDGLLDFGPDPRIVPFFEAWPLPNSTNNGDGTAEAIFSPTDVGNQDYWNARFDHTLSDQDSLFVSYLFSRSKRAANSDEIYWANATDSNIMLLTLQETRATARTVNTFKVAYSRSNLNSATNPTRELPENVRFHPGAEGLGALTFRLGTTTGVGGAISDVGTGRPIRNFTLNHFTFADDLFYQAGAHSFKIGGQLQRIQNHIWVPNELFGTMQFTDMVSLLTATPINFVIGNPGGGGDPTKAYRQWYTSFYFLDDYSVTPTLMLNLGLRWEFMTPPTEASGDRISNWRTQVIDGFSVVNTDPTVGAPYYESRKNNFAPRLGFAWDVFGDGNTSLRGGWGIYYNQIETEYKAIGIQNAPFFGTQVIPNPPFPNGLAEGATGTNRVGSYNGLQYNLDTPTKMQWNLNIQRQITPNTAVTVGYVGSQAYHLTRRLDANTARPTQILANGVQYWAADRKRLNPDLGPGTMYFSDATGSYQSLDLSVTQRFSRGLRYKVAFTWAKNIDSASATTSVWAIGNPNVTMQPDQLHLDRSLSSFHVGKNLVTNFTYDLPWVNSAGPAQWFGGWQLGSIMTFSDGMPVTILTGFSRSRNLNNRAADRPNLVSGSKNPVLGGPDLYFDPSGFDLPPAGFHGNLGRNTLISPGFANVDFTLAKIIPIREGMDLNFRAEFFNFFNRANFGAPQNQIFTRSGGRRGNAGRVSVTTTTARQVQFGLKLVF